jgi:hypothetical protein
MEALKCAVDSHGQRPLASIDQPLHPLARVAGSEFIGGFHCKFAAGAPSDSTLEGFI